jgi:hypothetical protein
VEERATMRDRFSASAPLALIWAALAACGASQSGVDAAKPVDAAADADALDAENPVDAAADADALDAASSDDVATGVDGPAGFFIVGDIDGQTWLATYNIMPVVNDFLFEVATVEPSPPSREWQFNFTLPADPFPYTLECVGNYIEFHEIGLNPERRFVSRTATSNCEVTFVEPTVAGTIEGTFTANLTLRGTTVDYPVTNGRFRLPRAP